MARNFTGSAAPVLSIILVFGLSPSMRVGHASELPHEIVLERQRAPYALESLNWCLAESTNLRIAKAPELSRQGIHRRVLEVGKDTNNAFAMIWDEPQRKLYLDLNHNLDLTDDPGPFLGTTNREAQGWPPPGSQFFTNVTLPLKTAWGQCPALVDLALQPMGDQRLIWANISFYSRWQAKLDFQGKEWQVGVVSGFLDSRRPSSTQFLLLRPWEERTNRVFALDLTPGVVRFPEKFLWQGQAFRLACRFGPQGGPSFAKLEFVPQQPPLIDLGISGEFLDRLILRATNGYTVMVEHPQGVVKIPQGVYSVDDVRLKKGSVEAVRLPGAPLIVNAAAATHLVLGGPLTNSVTLARRGKHLALDYCLVGADGGFYRLGQQDREHPPEFAIYRGGAKVASGKFQFG